MSRVKKVLASAMVVLLVSVLMLPATVSAKAVRKCSQCGKEMTYRGVLPLSEAVAMYQITYETRYGYVGPYVGQYTVKVTRSYSYARDIYYCASCNKTDYVRFKYCSSVKEERL